jgi:hypothetical protein
MDSLKEIISCLDRTEVCLIKSNFRLQEDKSKGKRLRLFQLIRENKVHSDEQAAKLLYRTKPNAAYSNLKQRLKQNVLNFILSRQNSKRTGQMTLAEGRIDCWRLLTLGQILVGRKAYQEAVKVMKLIEEVILRFDLKAERLVLEDLYQSDPYFSNRCGMNDFHQRQMGGCLLEVQFMIEGKACCNELEELFGKGLLLSADKAENISQTASNLGQLYDCDKSPVVGYWYLYLSAMQARLTGSIDEAKNFASELRQLVCDFPEMFLMSERLASEVITAQLTLCEGDFEALASQLDTLEARCEMSETLCLEVKEMRFRMHVAKSELNSASAVVQGVLSKDNCGKDRAQESKWYYHRAYLEFRAGRYRPATATLNVALTGLNAYSMPSLEARVLELLALLESGSQELFEYRLEAFHQFLKRNREPALWKYKEVCSILKLLVRYRYDYNQIAEPAVNSELKHDLARRDAYGFESLLHFNAWLNNKIGQIGLSQIA